MSNEPTGEPARAAPTAEGSRAGTRTSAPTPLAVGPDAPTRGRAIALPLRREGPAKLTGEALYADDLVFEGAWFGATIRSSEARARFDVLDLDDAFDWSKVVVATAADIPGDNVVSLIKDDQPILVPMGGEVQHHAEPLALVAAPLIAAVSQVVWTASDRSHRLAPALAHALLFGHLRPLPQGPRSARFEEDQAMRRKLRAERPARAAAGPPEGP